MTLKKIEQLCRINQIQKQKFRWKLRNRCTHTYLLFDLDNVEKTFFLNACTACSELPSNIRTMCRRPYLTRNFQAEHIKELLYVDQGAYTRW